MSATAHDINLALRTAAGHERAALKAEAEGAKQFEMKMKSAGASCYEAFVLAIKAAPDYQGRKIDDAAIRRIYQSTAPRKWWDVHLAAVKREDGKAPDREWSKRLIQWHLDPEAAKARRAAHSLRLANSRKSLGKPAARGARAPQAPTAAEAAEVRAASLETAAAGRAAPQLDAPEPVTLEELLGEVTRIQSAVRKVKDVDRAAVLETLRVTAREIEGYRS